MVRDAEGVGPRAAGRPRIPYVKSDPDERRMTVAGSVGHVVASGALVVSETPTRWSSGAVGNATDTQIRAARSRVRPGRFAQSGLGPLDGSSSDRGHCDGSEAVLHDAGEVVGVEAGPAHQRAVDVGLGHELRGVGRLHRAAVLDPHRRGRLAPGDLGRRWRARGRTPPGRPRRWRCGRCRSPRSARRRSPARRPGRA